MKFDLWVFFKNLSQKSQIWLISDRNNRYFSCTLMKISCCILLRMRNVLDKSCREN